MHLGDRVRIEVSDDGKGIDRQLIVQKAIEKQVITQEQAARLSEQEALELIFRPGFSTKDQATDLSGRGVGMDVVRETTNKLRGRLSLDTPSARARTSQWSFRSHWQCCPCFTCGFARTFMRCPFQPSIA